MSRVSEEIVNGKYLYFFPRTKSYLEIVNPFSELRDDTTAFIPENTGRLGRIAVQPYKHNVHPVMLYWMYHTLQHYNTIPCITMGSQWGYLLNSNT